MYTAHRDATHIERFARLGLANYYFERDYVPAIDPVSRSHEKLEWPSSIQGPVNVKTPESFSQFMELHLRHNHIALIDKNTVGFLQVLVPAFPTSEKNYGKLLQKRQEVRAARQQAFENLTSIIAEIEPSVIKQTTYTSVISQWFSDLE